MKSRPLNREFQLNAGHALNLPLDIVERFESLKGVAKSVREVQNRTVGSVYDIVRIANREVGKIARNLIGQTKAPAGHHVRHAAGRKG